MVLRCLVRNCDFGFIVFVFCKGTLVSSDLLFEKRGMPDSQQDALHLHHINTVRDIVVFLASKLLNSHIFSNARNQQVKFIEIPRLKGL